LLVRRRRGGGDLLQVKAHLDDLAGFDGDGLACLTYARLVRGDAIDVRPQVGELGNAVLVRRFASDHLEGLKRNPARITRTDGLGSREDAIAGLEHDDKVLDRFTVRVVNGRLDRSGVRRSRGTVGRLTRPEKREQQGGNEQARSEHREAMTGDGR
jgi:hypothetical protein